MSGGHVRRRKWGAIAVVLLAAAATFSLAVPGRAGASKRRGFDISVTFTLHHLSYQSAISGDGYNLDEYDNVKVTQDCHHVWIAASGKIYSHVSCESIGIDPGNSVEPEWEKVSNSTCKGQIEQQGAAEFTIGTKSDGKVGVVAEALPKIATVYDITGKVGSASCKQFYRSSTAFYPAWQREDSWPEPITADRDLPISAYALRHMKPGDSVSVKVDETDAETPLHQNCDMSGETCTQHLQWSGTVEFQRG